MLITNGVIVKGAGTVTVNGFYTPRGTESGKEYYNLEGRADNPFIASIVWDGSQWGIYTPDGDIAYSSFDDTATPELAAWSSAGFFGLEPAPGVMVLQQLNTPSSTVAAMFPSGAGSAETNAIHTERGTNGGKPYYNTIGQADALMSSSILWHDAGAGIFVWDIFNSLNTIIYRSLDNVATPDLVTTWIVAPGNEPAPVVFPITQGELDAGAFVLNAGTPEANGAYPSMPGSGVNRYQQIDNGHRVVSGNLLIPVWSVEDEVDGAWQYLNSTAAAFPFGLTFTVNIGDPPAPTVQRSNPAGEPNWGPVTP